MHTTIITTKDGKTYEGAINLFRPSFNYLTLFGINKKFSFDECLSIITPNERVSINSPVEGEICDEMLRAKKDLDEGRKYKWKQDGQLYPKEKFKWEKKYE